VNYVEYQGGIYGCNEIDTARIYMIETSQDLFGGWLHNALLGLADKFWLPTSAVKPSFLGAF
jgi:aryl-alcohol dehydrogenase-like predicted oxidoreductase